MQYNLWCAHVSLCADINDDANNTPNRPDPSAADLSAADAALQRAIVRFPEMVLTLAEKVGATLKPELASNPFFIASR